MRGPTKEQEEMMRVNPNPRIVALLDYAIDEITPRLRGPEFVEWLGWAASWKAGNRSPAACVNISHSCSSHSGPIWHTLGQLAWGAKEACYSTPTSGWLVIRYIADAMVAFGISVSSKGLPFLEPPTMDHERPGEQIIEAARKLVSR